MRTTALTACWLIAFATSVEAQRAILPHGDPTVKSEDDDRRREEIRDERLKQQGQGSDYRIEGVPQPPHPTTGPREESRGRQDTGIADPTVNPGQAANMRMVEGQVLRLDDRGYIIRNRDGQDVRLFIDEGTTGDTDLKPGDRISSRITPQGRAISIEKAGEETAR